MWPVARLGLEGGLVCVPCLGVPLLPLGPSSVDGAPGPPGSGPSPCKQDPCQASSRTRAHSRSLRSCLVLPGWRSGTRARLFCHGPEPALCRACALSFATVPTAPSWLSLLPGKQRWARWRCARESETFLVPMSLPQVPKRKREREGGVFREKWERAYFFVEVKSVPTCLICNKIVSVLKEYNLRRHYKSKHSKSYDQYTEQTRDAILDQLKKGLKCQ